jgi:2-polyprenyl-6-methoxyphenol hydroxylase-like FAD-dependent oxidoreductase
VVPGRALVVGAGIGGLTTAIALRRSGWEVTVFERAPGPGALRTGAGIHLWHNAMRVLSDLGIGEQVCAVGWRQRVAEFCTWRGDVLASWPIEAHEHRFGVPTLGVSRADLQPVLAGVVTALGAELRLGMPCRGVRDQGGHVLACFADGTRERGDVLVGADGLHSTVRAGLLAEPPPRYAGYTIWQAIIDFPHDRVPAGTFRVLYGRGARFAYYHVGGGRLYWFGLANAPARGRDPEHGPRDRLVALFAGWARPVEAIVGATPPGAIQRQDIRDRKPVRRWGRGRVTLLGDAAHPMTFNVGQGACQAIEDVAVLARQLQEADDAVAALRAYERLRRPRTTAVTRRAWRLGAVAAWESLVACALRDRALRLVLSTVGLRGHERDMAFTA